jgi:hypothetical protein
MSIGLFPHYSKLNIKAGTAWTISLGFLLFSYILVLLGFLNVNPLFLFISLIISWIFELLSSVFIFRTVLCFEKNAKTIKALADKS